MLECAVYLTLRRLGAQVAYWRGRGEVDFIVSHQGALLPVQVSWDGPSDRHHRALEEFYETFPQAEEALFIGPNEYQQERLQRLLG